MVADKFAIKMVVKRRLKTSLKVYSNNMETLSFFADNGIFLFTSIRLHCEYYGIMTGRLRLEEIQMPRYTNSLS